MSNIIFVFIQLFFLIKKQKIDIVINMIVEATTIDGPDGVSRYKEL